MFLRSSLIIVLLLIGAWIFARPVHAADCTISDVRLSRTVVTMGESVTISARADCSAGVGSLRIVASSTQVAKVEKQNSISGIWDTSKQTWWSGKIPVAIIVYAADDPNELRATREERYVTVNASNTLSTSVSPTPATGTQDLPRPACTLFTHGYQPGKSIRVTTGCLNIRTAPNTSSAVIGKALLGSRFVRSGDGGNDPLWYAIEYIGGMRAWIARGVNGRFSTGE